jgi:hypothetical protein
VRPLLRCCLVAVLIVSLIEAPVLAAPSPALGVILEAAHARVGPNDAVDGVTVFDGDTLATDQAGSVRARVGVAQLRLLADSAAVMHRTPDAVTAALQRGTLIFSSKTARAIEVRASQARILPKTAELTLAQITLVGPNEFLLTCQRGVLEVLVGDEVHTVRAATSYRVTIEPEANSGQAAPAQRAGKAHFLLIALILIGAGTGIGVWRALVSPDKP